MRQVQITHGRRHHDNIAGTEIASQNELAGRGHNVTPAWPGAMGVFGFVKSLRYKGYGVQAVQSRTGLIGASRPALANPDYSTTKNTKITKQRKRCPVYWGRISHRVIHAKRLFS